ncbi:VOC family protein [Streptomyces sp. NPDC005708]|uniref:VOC family protein n=1 Tax=Streptomyces sp. NPDC005708 TaxID=3154564 RepID=UPI003406BD16
MIDHIYLPVTNLEKSLAFYTALLTPLGKGKTWEFKAQAGWPDLWGFGAPRPGFWLRKSKQTLQDLYIAFSALNEGAVNNAYNAALNSGGSDNGKPGLLTHFNPRYYGANVLDPDGYNVEICFKP